jgi:hypothetical protein
MKRLVLAIRCLRGRVRHRRHRRYSEVIEHDRSSDEQSGRLVTQVGARLVGNGEKAISRT